MLNTKGVIFDFNGTLFFDNPKHVLAWSKISQDIRKCGVSEEELREHMNGVPNNKIIEYLYGGNCSKEDNDKYSALKEEYYREFCKEDKESFHLVKGAEQYFDNLKENHIPFTIASASIKPNIDFFVESFHLDHWINPNNIVYDDGTYANKIAMFKKAAEVIDVDIKDCLIIEDSISGIKSAYEAGCHHIIVVNSANKKEEYEKLPGVIKVIDTFDELLMKKVIVYASVHHGNTEKVVKRIAEECHVDLINATKETNVDLSQYDMVGFASGIFLSNFHKSVLKFAENHLPDNKKVFLICIYGGSANYKSIEEVFAKKKATVIGKFGCKGYDTFGPFKLIGGIAKGHPDENELNKAVSFVKNL